MLANREQIKRETARAFDEFRDPVFRFIVGICRARSVADDLTQDVFLKLHRELIANRRPKNLKSWLFTVARNATLNSMRQARFYLDDPTTEGSLEHLASMTPTSEEAMVGAQRRMSLAVALSQLTPLQRQCLDLRCEGLRYREIAEVLGTSSENVGDALRRAVNRLRGEMNP